MILVVTAKRDLTSDFIILELQRRKLSYFRLNSEDIVLGGFQYKPSERDAWVLNLPAKSFKLSEVKAAYFRRPRYPQPQPDVDGGAQEYAAQEWQSSLQSLYWALGDRWLNAPHLIAAAEDKIRQLSLAVELGLRVPATLIGNDPVASLRFCEQHKDVVGKPLKTALISGSEGDSVMFTSRIKVTTLTNPKSIEACPLILQAEIKKRFDVRVTVVGEQVFSVTIDSQRHEATQVDWRKTSSPDLEHAICALPEELRKKCTALTKALGLRFGAIDLVLDQVGDFWFLEINPNGQWAWIENRTGLPIAAALVDELEAISRA